MLKEGKTNWKYIIIVLVLAVMVGGGILSWIKIQEVTLIELPEIELPEKEELDYKGLLSKVFPEKEFVDFDKENCFQDEEEVFYCIDEVKEGLFTNTEKKENLLVIREGYFFGDGKPRYPHAAGITHILLAVFDKESKEILSEPFYLIADTGEVAFYECKNGTNILFYGDSGGQGYITGDTRLLKIDEGKFKTVWPDEKVWNHIDTMVKPEKGKLAVYEREYVQSDFVCPTDCLIEFIVPEGGLMPSYAFIYSYSMNWNSDTCKFEKDKTADWKTYRNEKYGFEFQYPPIPDCGFCKLDRADEEGFMVNRTSLDVESLEGLTLSEFANKEMEMFEIESREEHLIDGKEAISASYRFGGMNRYGQVTFIEKDDKVIILSFTAGGFCCTEGEEIYELELYSAILPTFKFLD